jgi:hypothetical protein
MPSCFETPRHSASKTRVNALKARLLSMRASRDTWLELTPTPRSPPVTRGMGTRLVGGDPVRPRGHPLRETQRNYSQRDGLPVPAMTVGEFRPSRPWPTRAVITADLG